MADERHNVSRRTVLGAGAAATVAAVTGTGAAIDAPVPAVAIPPVRRSPPIDIVCDECGGTNVSRDAWAEWDATAQDWVLGAVFDYGHCHDCDGESRLEEVPLPKAS